MGRPFYRRRLGAGDHIKSGEISFFDDGLHDFICMKAQHQVGNGSPVPPGVWIGSARTLWFLTCRQDEERKIRRSLEKLERLGWIKRWHRQGETGDYPILINRLVVRDQDGNDFSVNAEATKDWKHPVLVPLDDPRREASVRRPRSVRGVSGYYIDSRLVDSNTLSPVDALQRIWKEHHGILPASAGTSCDFPKSPAWVLGSTRRNHECTTPSTCRVWLSMVWPRSRNSLMRVLYCAACGVIS